MKKLLDSPIEISIDQGGTFTDVFALYRSKTIIEKLPSKGSYQSAPIEGIRRVLQRVSGEREIRAFMHPGNFSTIRMGTTVATNTLLERKGEPTALAVSSGFESLLEISDQTRPQLFNWNISKPPPLYETVIGTRERVIPGKSGPEILTPLDQDLLSRQLDGLRGEGFRSIAIVFMHSFQYPQHELIAADIARQSGFQFISLSHEVMPSIKILRRGNITVLDAYLTPVIRDYLNSFFAEFDGEFNPGQVLFMKSDGGLCDASDFRASHALLSGPAGGFIGYSASLYAKTPLIGYDMGGTSTDVSRFDGNIPLEMEHKISGLPIKAPHLNIHTVAAGGGSRLDFESGLMSVGPMSSGAEPGPLCYGRNGFLSLTDANLILGRLIPDFFPQVFGPSSDSPINPALSLQGMEEMTREINGVLNPDNQNQLSVEEAALGFVRIANEAMARPILEISAEKGFDPRDHHLVCFGGAGAQHACSIARILGIRKVLIPFHSGVLSAIGLSQAKRSNTRILPVHKRLTHECESWIAEQTEPEDRKPASLESGSRVVLSLMMRYEGTDTLLRIKPEEGISLEKSFQSQYCRIFGFLPEDRPIWVEEINIVTEETNSFSFIKKPTLAKDKNTQLNSKRTHFCRFEEGLVNTPVFEWDEIPLGREIQGPVLILSPTSTTVVDPGCIAELESREVLSIKVPYTTQKSLSIDIDPIELSLFQHRFMSLAEQMGRMLQRISVSTNIKERLDFSCALFDPRGNLVSNAPHIPVHLGSMSQCVKSALDILEPRDGEVWITNHPGFGGTHLPDITVITPFFHKTEVLGYLASRGHHADIGGVTPGSMPSHSTHLNQEGVLLAPSILVQEGKFREKWIRGILQQAGARLLEDNISDLKAQVSANQKGCEILSQLIEQYGENTLREAMIKIQEIGENAVRSYFKTLAQRSMIAEDFLDDGSRIHLQVKLDPSKGEAVFDFRKTCDQHPGNQNASLAVVSSAVIYCLRCMISRDLPLNEGILRPVQIITRKGSMLNPDPQCAVAAGNVTTSQRIVDTILKAFGICAASQGCMNNLSLGNEDTAYYETIGGGVGAGENYHGTSGVHTHMTNTKATDPEVLERNFPLILREFSIRKGSGGEGKFRGGCGLIREIEARVPIQANLITERRRTSPYGIQGGGNGTCGKNTFIPANPSSSPISLDGKCSIQLKSGDRLRIETPGGGGFGKSE